MDFFKNNFVVGLTAALAASIITPLMMPAIRRGSRPAAKGVIRGGMLLYRKGRQAVAVSGEMIEDVLAEIRAEDLQRREQGRALTAGRNGTARTAPPPSSAAPADSAAAAAIHETPAETMPGIVNETVQGMATAAPPAPTPAVSPHAAPSVAAGGTRQHDGAGMQDSEPERARS